MVPSQVGEKKSPNGSQAGDDGEHYFNSLILLPGRTSELELTTNGEISIASEFDYDASKYQEVEAPQILAKGPMTK